jgi:hypothetical protein
MIETKVDAEAEIFAIVEQVALIMGIVSDDRAMPNRTRVEIYEKCTGALESVITLYHLENRHESQRAPGQPSIASVASPETAVSNL